MRRLLAAAIGCLFLAACAPTPRDAAHDGGHTDDGHAHDEDYGTRDLFVSDKSNRGDEIAFTITEGDALFTDYGVSHTKEMHVIAVRDDLRHFQHLHPERDAAGVWRTPFLPGAAGNYRVYTDFVDASGGTYVFLMEKEFPGPGDDGALLVKDAKTRVKTVDGYQIAFVPELDGDVLMLRYRITNNGKPVELDDYLGAKGHAVLLAADGGYIHTHPEVEEGTNPLFLAENVREDFYRIYAQFQIDGRVLTTVFDWERD